MKKFGSVVLILIITGALLEGASWVALRLLSEQPDPVKSETHLFDAHANHRLNPTFQFSKKSESRIHSPDGFRRDKPVPLVKPEGTIRIVVLGTSALYGAGAAPPYPVHRPLYNNETITHFLEVDLTEMARKAGMAQRVEIINAGVSATKTFHHLIRLNESLMEYAPDIVLNLDGHNDFYADKLVDRWSRYSYSTNVLVDEFNGRTGYLALFTTVRALAPYSSFFNLCEKGFKRLWHATKLIGNTLPHTPKRDFGQLNDGKADIRETARRSYLRDLWQIHQLGSYMGFDHCVFLQPEVVFEKGEFLSASDREIRKLTVSLMGDHQVALMRDVRTVLPDMFKEAGIPYHDLGQIASDATEKESLYIDYCHLTPRGAEVLAGRMAEFVFPLVAKRAGR